MSRAGRRARRERLTAAGLWDSPPLRARPRPAPITVLAGTERLGWLWQHRSDGHPRVAMLVCWQRAIEAMEAEAQSRNAAPRATMRKAA